MRRQTLALTLLLTVAILGYTTLSFYSLKTSSVETNASCAIGDSGTWIPRRACYWYLGYQLDPNSQSDAAQRVLHLAIGAYPTQREGARGVIQLALAEGARINGLSPVSGYPPLHEAIVLNEPALAGFLLERGADPTIRDRNKGLTATGLLSILKERNPKQDWSAIEERLQRQAVGQ